MNPWWKRPSSESSSSAARSQADNRSRSRSKPKDDSDDSSPKQRRRGGRRGANNSNDNNQDQSSRRQRGGGGRGRRRGGRNSNNRSRGGQRGRNPQRSQAGNGQTVAVLVDVEALHKHIKASGGKLEDAGTLFSDVGPGVALRAIACGKRKQKVQRSLSSLGFDIEQVEGGVEDARLRLALDAMELAIAHSGAQIYCLEHKHQMGVLADRLRHHGAELFYFSSENPPVVSANMESTASDDSDDSDDANDSQESNSKANARGKDRSQDSDDSDGRRGGRRRRRRGRRGDQSDDQPDNQPGDKPGHAPRQQDSKPARKPRKDSSKVEPLSLLSAAIRRLTEGESQLIWATRVRQEMSSIEPTFDETEHGYDDFEGLLREAERRGRVALQKDPRTSTFVIVGWRAA